MTYLRVFLYVITLSETAKVSLGNNAKLSNQRNQTTPLFCSPHTENPAVNETLNVSNCNQTTTTDSIQQPKMETTPVMVISTTAVTTPTAKVTMPSTKVTTPTTKVTTPTTKVTTPTTKVTTPTTKVTTPTTKLTTPTTKMTTPTTKVTTPTTKLTTPTTKLTMPTTKMTTPTTKMTTPTTKMTTPTTKLTTPTTKMTTPTTKLTTPTTKLTTPTTKMTTPTSKVTTPTTKLTTPTTKMTTPTSKLTTPTTKLTTPTTKMTTPTTKVTTPTTKETTSTTKVTTPTTKTTTSAIEITSLKNHNQTAITSSSQIVRTNLVTTSTTPTTIPKNSGEPTLNAATLGKTTQILKTVPNIINITLHPGNTSTHETTMQIVQTTKSLPPTVPGMTTESLQTITTIKVKKERTTKEKTTKMKKTRPPTISKTRTTKLKTSTTEEDQYDLIGITTPPPEPDKTALNVIEGSALPNPIAVGAEKFEDLIKNGNIFIDKTLLVKEMVEYNGSLKLVNFPSGWGKTMNMLMMKTFFQLQIDKKTNEVLPRNQTKAYKLFEHGELTMEDGQVRKLRNPLLISAERDMMMRYQGQYFIVHLSFAGMKPKSYHDYVKQTAARITQTYKEHIYIAIVLNTAIKDPNCPPDAKEQLKSRLTFFRNIITGKASQADLEISLSFLCKMLGEYYANKTIILIEDYDQPLYEVLLYPKFPNKSPMVGFITNLMAETLQNNNYYEMAIVSGMVNIKLPGVVFDPQFHTLHTELLQYYGFNQRETDAIFDHLDLSEELREKVILQYGGYKSGRELKMNISMPASIAKFLASGKIENYWGGFEIFNMYLARLFKIPRFLLAFLTITSDYMYVTAISDLEMTVLDFDALSILMRYSKAANKKQDEETFPVELAMKLLYVSGYLTARTYWPEQLHVACPNEETKSLILDILYPFTTTPFYYD